MGLWDKIKHSAETAGSGVVDTGRVLQNDFSQGLQTSASFLDNFMPPTQAEMLAMQQQREQNIRNLRARALVQQALQSQATGQSNWGFNPRALLDPSQVQDRRMELPNPFTLALLYGLNDRQINHGF